MIEKPQLQNLISKCNLAEFGVTRKFYVYVYRDPNNNEWRYVGKGKHKRVYQHLTERPSKNRKYRYIRSLLLLDMLPIISCAYQTDSEKEALLVERFLIALFGRLGYEKGGVLLNHSKGGWSGAAGVKRSQSTRKKIAAAKRGKKRGPLGAESKRKMGESRRGERNGMFGKPHPEKGKRNPKHPRLKRWTLVDPAGELHTTTSLKAFCRDMFGSYGQATALRNTVKSGRAVSSGVCKGWRVVSVIGASD